MTRFGLSALLLTLAACGGGGSSTYGGGDIREGQLAIAQRKFDKAGEILSRYGNDRLALRLLGRLRLNQNQPKEAIRLLTRSLSMVHPKDPPDLVARQEIAWACVRQDDYRGAARAYEALNDHWKKARADRLAKKVPYVVDWKGNDAIATRLISADPLPIVAVRINGSAVGNFILDTNVSHLVIEREFARKSGISVLQANAKMGWADSVEINKLKVRNVPVAVREMKTYQGRIGTLFLSHFLVRLDLKRNRLELAPPRDFVTDGIPMLFGADRYLVLKGGLYDREAWFFLMTALSDADLSPSPQVMVPEKLRLGPIVRDKPSIVAGNDYVHGIGGTIFGFVIEGIAGYPLLKGRVLTLDFKSMRAKIE